jgi:hypothetical protein
VDALKNLEPAFVIGAAFLAWNTVWLISFLGLVYFVLTWRPKNLKSRRWKASLLVAGLPVLAIAFLVPALLSVPLLVKTIASGIGIEQLLMGLPMLFASMASLSACSIPLSILMGVIATLGTYRVEKQTSNYWTNRLVPPDEDEKPDPDEWY